MVFNSRGDRATLTSHFSPRSIQRGADAVFRHPRLVTDLPVALSFQVILANDLFLAAIQTFQKTCNLFTITQTLFGRTVCRPISSGRFG